MGKLVGKSRKHLPLRRRLAIGLRRRFNRARKIGWAVRRFFTLEARPEDIKLRREVEALLEGKYGLAYTPGPQIEKALRIALGEYKGHYTKEDDDEAH